MMTTLSILEIIGYAASAIIAISMTMNSIVKFRMINLLGASLFCAYGILIGALPVALLNGFIVMVDLYYLYGIFSKKEIFEILQVRSDNRYLKRFLSFHHKDIQRFFPGYDYQQDTHGVSFFILRDMAVAGVFLAHQHGEVGLMVDLDYVIAEYRDFKNGKFVYHHLKNEFIRHGYHEIFSAGHTPKHKRYLEKLGFARLEGDLYMIRLHKGN